MKENKEKLNLKEALKNLKRTIKYLKPYKKQVFLNVLLTLIITVLSVLGPLLSAKLMIYLTNGNLNKILIIALIILIFEVCECIFHNLDHLLFSKMNEKVVLSIQMELLKEIFNLETKEFDKTNSGIFIERLRRDTRDISRIFSSLNTSVFSALSSLGVLITIFALNKIMFCFMIFSMICKYIIQERRTVKVTKLREKYHELEEKNTGFVNEFIRGMRDIKVLNSKENSIALIEENVNKVIDNKLETAKVSFKFDVFADNTYSILKFLLIVLGCILVRINNLTIETFIIIYMYKNDAFYLINEITRTIDLLEDFNVSAVRVFELIDKEKYKKEHYGTIHINKCLGKITFKNVSFSYNGKNKVLNNVNFEALPNQTIGFVGKSGSGKTTIFALINKMYDVDNNMIFIDDYDINSLDEASIRNNISLVMQNPYIFNMSIKDNLRIINKSASDKKIKEVCKIACIHDFIMSLPNKYDTVVGEGGVVLSGGQRQRLAIARALLRQTKIILFDEATSALDNETQSLIQKSINNMKGNYTMLIIAHRLSTIINSDKIYFIDNGKVIDEGTHEELLQKNKEYKNLYEMEIKKCS